MKFKILGEEDKAIKAELRVAGFGDSIRLYLNDEHILSIDKQGLHLWEISDNLGLPKVDNGVIRKAR